MIYENRSTVCGILLTFFGFILFLSFITTYKSHAGLWKQDSTSSFSKLSQYSEEDVYAFASSAFSDGLFTNSETMLVSTPILSQRRAKVQSSCYNDPDTGSSSCFASYSYGDIDESDFIPSGGSTLEKCFKKSDLNEKSFIISIWEVIGNVCSFFWDIFSMTDRSGMGSEQSLEGGSSLLFGDFPFHCEYSTANEATMKSDEWIDTQTAAITLSYATLNLRSATATQVQVLFSRLPTGAFLRKSIDISTRSVWGIWNDYESFESRFVLLIGIGLGLVLLNFVHPILAGIMRLLYRRKNLNGERLKPPPISFKTFFWSLFLILFEISSLVGIGFMLFAKPDDYVLEDVFGLGVARDMLEEHIFYAQICEHWMVLLLFIHMVSCLRYMEAFHSIRLLVRTIQRVLRTVFVTMVLFIIILVSFCFMISLIGGSDIGGLYQVIWLLLDTFSIVKPSGTAIATVFDNSSTNNGTIPSHGVLAMIPLVATVLMVLFICLVVSLFVSAYNSILDSPPETETIKRHLGMKSAFKMVNRWFSWSNCCKKIRRNKNKNKTRSLLDMPVSPMPMPPNIRTLSDREAFNEEQRHQPGYMSGQYPDNFRDQCLKTPNQKFDNSGCVDSHFSQWGLTPSSKVIAAELFKNDPSPVKVLPQSLQNHNKMLEMHMKALMTDHLIPLQRNQQAMLDQLNMMRVKVANVEKMRAYECTNPTPIKSHKISQHVNPTGGINPYEKGTTMGTHDDDENGEESDIQNRGFPKRKPVGAMNVQVMRGPPPPIQKGRILVAQRTPGGGFKKYMEMRECINGLPVSDSPSPQKRMWERMTPDTQRFYTTSHTPYSGIQSNSGTPHSIPSQVDLHTPINTSEKRFPSTPVTENPSTFESPLPYDYAESIGSAGMFLQASTPTHSHNNATHANIQYDNNSKLQGTPQFLEDVIYTSPKHPEEDDVKPANIMMSYNLEAASVDLESRSFGTQKEESESGISNGTRESGTSRFPNNQMKASPKNSPKLSASSANYAGFRHPGYISDMVIHEEDTDTDNIVEEEEMSKEEKREIAKLHLQRNRDQSVRRLLEFSQKRKDASNRRLIPSDGSQFEGEGSLIKEGSIVRDNSNPNGDEEDQHSSKHKPKHGVKENHVSRATSVNES